MSSMTMMAAVLTVSALTSTQTAPDRAAPPKSGPVRPFTIQQPTELKLKNGMRVLLFERKRAPLVDVVAAVNAGSVIDDVERPGVAGWTADMLTEGAGDLDAIAFSDAVQALGASVDADAQPEYATVTLHSTSARFGEALKLFALALTKPRFDEKDWQRVRQQTLGYFVYQSQEPQELAGLAGARENWGTGHRLGWNLAGTPKALTATATADLKRFHGERYRPEYTTLVVVGDVDKKTAQKLLDEALGGWAGDPDARAVKRAAPAGPQALAGKRLVTVHVPSAAQTVLRVQNPSAPDIQPYTPDVDVMNTLLGGSFTSRLNTNLREEHGYSYGAGSRVLLFSFGNAFTVRTSVATPVTAPATVEILGELKRIKETAATTEEVERARNLAALSMPSTFETGRTTAMVWAGIVARGIDPRRLQKFMDEAPKVDGGALQKAAGRVIDTERFTIVAVGDMEKVGADLEKLAPRTSLSVADLLPGLEEAMAKLGGGGGGDGGGGE